MPGNSDSRPATTPIVRSKVWIERDGVVLMSDFRAGLLEAVQAAGSVAAAAEVLGLPYRTAWKKLREMEDAAGEALLASGSGGAHGGQSRLTPAAAEMLAAYRRISRPVDEAVQGGFEMEAGHFVRRLPRAAPS